jgi:protein ImuB
MVRSRSIVVCVHLPRFELVVAAGGHEALSGKALAIALPSAGTPEVGEVSGTAEASGVVRGMSMAEALARCPALALLPGDPLGVVRAWEGVACALEGIGADVELARAGIAYFDAGALSGYHGGVEGVIAATRRALGRRPVRIGASPTRFCALAAALEARTRRARVLGPGEARLYLASKPVSLLSYRAQTAALVEPLERLGIGTLGKLAALGADAVCDRFGKPGLLARRLALGHDEPLRPRRLEDRLEESLELSWTGSQEALERALDLLLGRLLSRRERRGRAVRAMTLSARLAERGTWCERVVFRQALTDRRTMRIVLGTRLALLPAPPETLALAVESFGPAPAHQLGMLDRERAARAQQVREAVGQLRVLAGPDAALRIAPMEPRSRVPERRFAYTPFAP